MGFMAGFGPAFADSFNAGNERRAKRKDDMFKLTYSEYLNRREEYEKLQQKDAAATKKAKALAEAYGAPTEALPKIREWVGADMSDAAIADLLENGEFEVRGTPDLPTTSAIAPTGTDIPSPDAQMASALPQPASDEPKAPQQEPSLMDKIFPERAKNSANRLQEESLNSVAEVTGQSPEEIKNVLHSKNIPQVPDGSGIVYKKKPEKLKLEDYNTEPELAIQVNNLQRKYDENPTAENEVNLKVMQDHLRSVQALEENKILQKINTENAAKGIVGANSARVKVRDPDGEGFQVVNIIEKDGEWFTVANNKPINLNEVVKISENEQKAVDQLRKEFTTKVEKHQPKINAALDLVRVGKGASDIIKASGGRATARRVGNFSALAQEWAVELDTIKSLVESDGDTSRIINELDSIDKNIDGMISKGVNDLATYNKLLEAKLTVFSYKLGISMGQEGRSLSETERVIFDKMASASGSPEKFNQNIALIIKDQVSSIDQASKDMLDLDQSIKGFKEDYQWSPVDPIPSLPQLMAKDKELNEAWNFFKPYMNINVRQETQQNEDGSVTIKGYKIRKRQ